jgi:hypothetical protein
VLGASTIPVAHDYSLTQRLVKLFSYCFRCSYVYSIFLFELPPICGWDVSFILFCSFGTYSDDRDVGAKHEQEEADAAATLALLQQTQPNTD